MTVSTLNVINEYIGDGVELNFAFTFQSLDSEWVLAYVDDVLTPVTVSLNANQEVTPGGSVTFAVAPADLSAVRIERVADFTQETDYAPYTRFPARSHESALDKLTMLAQQNNYDIDFINDLLATTEIVSSDTNTITISNPFLFDDTVINPITNVPNGLVKLDGTGTIPVSLIPVVGGNEFPGDDPVFPQVGATPDAALIIGTIDPQNEPSIAIGPTLIQARLDAENAGTLRLNAFNGNTSIGPGQSQYLNVSAGTHQWRANNFNAMYLSAASLRLSSTGAIPTNVGLRFTEPDDGDTKSFIGYDSDNTLRIENRLTGAPVEVYADNSLDTQQLTATFTATLSGLPSRGGIETPAINITVSSPVDLSGIDNALNIGTDDPASDPHLALSPNVIQAKTNGSTAEQLQLNPFGGDILTGGEITTYIAGTLTGLDLQNDVNGVRVEAGNDSMRLVMLDNAGVEEFAPFSYFNAVATGTLAAYDGSLRTRITFSTSVVELYNSENLSMLQTVLESEGGIQVRNTVTGVGFERVLTESDLSGLGDFLADGSVPLTGSLKLNGTELIEQQGVNDDLILQVFSASETHQLSLNAVGSLQLDFDSATRMFVNQEELNLRQTTSGDRQFFGVVDSAFSQLFQAGWGTDDNAYIESTLEGADLRIRIFPTGGGGQTELLRFNGTSGELEALNGESSALERVLTLSDINTLDSATTALDLNLSAGNTTGSGDNYDGADVVIRAGDGFRNSGGVNGTTGGDVSITGGDQLGDGFGGDIIITSGQGLGTTSSRQSGTVTLATANGFDSVSGDGGNVGAIILGAGDGGDATGGTGDGGNGGVIILDGGSPGTSVGGSPGSFGNIRFRLGISNDKILIEDEQITVYVPLGLANYTVASAPTGAAAQLIYVSDGDAGSPCLAVHNGTDWLRVPLGAAISAT